MKIDRNELDRYITGNYGEDQFNEIEESKPHTPGPWIINTLNGKISTVLEVHSLHGEAPTYNSSIIRDTEPPFKFVCKLNFGYGKPEDKANARLIAAAPELLEALERHTKMFDEYQYRQTGDFYTLLFRAIQQADGQNLDRLAKGFPTEVEAYKCWTRIRVKEFVKRVSPGHRLLDPFKAEYQLRMQAVAIDGINVTGNEYGISKGWFNWPFNFDPTWLDTCDGWEQDDG